MSLSLVVLFEFQPGHESEIKVALTTLAAATRAEAGCKGFQIHQSKDNPSQFMMYENWQDQAALEQHDQTAHLKAFQAVAKPLFAKSPQVTFWTPIMD